MQVDGIVLGMTYKPGEKIDGGRYDYTKSSLYLDVDVPCDPETHSIRVDKIFRNRFQWKLLSKKQRNKILQTAPKAGDTIKLDCKTTGVASFRIDLAICEITQWIERFICVVAR